MFLSHTFNKTARYLTSQRDATTPSIVWDQEINSLRYTRTVWNCNQLHSDQSLTARAPFPVGWSLLSTGTNAADGLCMRVPSWFEQSTMAETVKLSRIHLVRTLVPGRNFEFDWGSGQVETFYPYHPHTLETMEQLRSGCTRAILRTRKLICSFVWQWIKTHLQHFRHRGETLVMDNRWWCFSGQEWTHSISGSFRGGWIVHCVK